MTALPLYAEYYEKLRDREIIQDRVVYFLRYGNPFLSSIEGVFCNDNIVFSSLDIPDSLTASNGQVFKVSFITPDAFKKCSIGKLTLPGSIEELNADALAGMKISEIEFKPGIRQICPRALRAIEGLSSLELPEGLVAVSHHAAADNLSLSSISFPSTIEYIGSGAFSGCPEITEIKVYAKEPPEIDKDVFGLTNDGHSGKRNMNPDRCVLTVPEGCEEKYRSAKGWNMFRHIETMPLPVANSMKDDMTGF